jgi:HAD superfamily hydrolase (TIGR01450 family)
VTVDVRMVLCDLDGVVWLAHQPIPGSVEAIATLQAAGIEVLFVTNNSTSPPTAVEEVLASIGVNAHNKVVGSAAAAASLLAPGERVMVCGERGIQEAVDQVGAHRIDPHDPHDAHDPHDPCGLDGSEICETVVVGLDRRFNYQVLDRVSAAIRLGARFIATNDDPTYPTPHGVVPGAGSVVAAVSAASGVRPILAGKPHRPMADLVLRIMQSFTDPISPSQVVMVGDRLSTDGRFAQTLGCSFAWVRSGVASDAAVGEEIPITYEGANLAEVATALQR